MVSGALIIDKAAERGYPNVRRCAHPMCAVVLFTQAANDRCRLHRSFAGKCCGDAACQYGSRRVF